MRKGTEQALVILGLLVLLVALLVLPDWRAGWQTTLGALQYRMGLR